MINIEQEVLLDVILMEVLVLDEVEEILEEEMVEEEQIIFPQIEDMMQPSMEDEDEEQHFLLIIPIANEGMDIKEL
ncbi:MAG: hypothetical protein LBH96_00765 [Candidatus Peribacteria bacterium]|nr:hypothetical protein [Candidatus Peribacteria bacterium]